MIPAIASSVRWKFHGYMLSYIIFSQSVHLLIKEYYKIVDEARTHADFFYSYAFLIMKLSTLPSFKVIQALIASQSTFEK